MLQRQNKAFFCHEDTLSSWYYSIFLCTHLTPPPARAHCSLRGQKECFISNVKKGVWSFCMNVVTNPFWKTHCFIKYWLRGVSTISYGIITRALKRPLGMKKKGIECLNNGPLSTKTLFHPFKIYNDWLPRWSFGQRST